MYRQSNGDWIFYQGELTVYHGERFPHWEVDDGIYFATMKLDDAITREESERLGARYSDLMEAFRSEGDIEAATVDNAGFEFFLEHVDPHLDDGAGACCMNDPRIA